MLTEKFQMHMESGLAGVDLLMDSIPHTNSMLIELMGEGKVGDLHIQKRTDYLIKILWAKKAVINYFLSYWTYSELTASILITSYL